MERSDFGVVISSMVAAVCVIATLKFDATIGSVATAAGVIATAVSG